MPGVFVSTTSSPGPSASSQAPAATYFVVGQTERGSTTAATAVHSMSEYADLLGNRVTYGSLYDDLSNYFAEGGTLAYVARVVGAAATTGALTLQDGAGTPVPTVRLNAISAGSWSTQLTVQVTADLIPNSFVISLFLNGNLVERYPNLTSPAQAVTAINGKSAYVTATNLNSATVAPANNPAVIAATPLAAGADDRASITTGALTGALARFGPELGSGAVAIPGQGASLVGTALLSHALNNSRLALLAPPAGSSPATIKTDAAALRGTLGSEFGGYFYPWVTISDGAGSVRTVSPEGYVAGVRARTHLAVGPWQAPAGQFSRSYNLIGLESTSTTDAATATDLNNNNISCIRVIQGQVRLYGYRSLSTDSTNYRFLSDRDFLNYIATQGQILLEPFVFGTIDARGQFFASMSAALRGLLEPIRVAGGIYPAYAADGTTLLDPGYLIDTGPSVNTQAKISQGIATANVAVRKSGTAETINVQITKVAIGTAL